MTRPAHLVRRVASAAVEATRESWRHPTGSRSVLFKYVLFTAVCVVAAVGGLVALLASGLDSGAGMLVLAAAAGAAFYGTQVWGGLTRGWFDEDADDDATRSQV